MLLYLRPGSIFHHDSITCSQLLRIPYPFLDNRPLSCWSGLEVANRPTAVSQLCQGDRRRACGRRDGQTYEKRASQEQKGLDMAYYRSATPTDLLYSFAL